MENTMLPAMLLVYVVLQGNFIHVIPYDQPATFHSSGMVFRSVEHELVNQFSSPGDVVQWINYLFSNTLPPNITASCATDFSFLVNGTKLQQEWALQFVDAAGKPGPGILQGGLQWLGSFGECRAITRVRNNATDGYFNGQYCLTTIGYPILLQNVTQSPGAPQAIKIGLCMPDSCSESDTSLILSYGISKLPAPYNVDLVVEATSCQPGTIPFDSTSITILFFLSLFSVLLVGATVYDVSTNYRSKNKAMVVVATVSSTPKTASKTPLTASEENDSRIVEDDQSLQKKMDPSTNLSKNVSNNSAMYMQLLLVFSLYSNGKKILDTSKQPDSAITCINGIRFLSMTWVLLGHVYSVVPWFLRDPLIMTPKITGGFWFQPLVNGSVAVDTFFVMSGLLGSYLFVLAYEKTKEFRYLQFYIHRYWRLTPVYAIVMVVYLFLFKHFGSGPTWVASGLSVPNCAVSWWTNLLYINNLVHVRQWCMEWTWYLGADMQFYWISPLILLPLVRWPKIGFTTLGVFFVTHILATAIICATYNIAPNISGYSAFRPLTETETYQYSNYYYNMPWTRIGPYLIGILFGYLLAKYRKENVIKIRTVFVVMFWLMAMASGLAVVYGLQSINNRATELSPPVATLYNVLHRNVWALAVCWVIFACVQGYGGFVNTLLSWNAFVPLSRLTYCGYLVHIPVLFVYVRGKTTTDDFSNLEVVYFFFGTLILTYGFAFLFSVGFEAPLLGLEKYLMKRIDTSKKK